MIEPTEFLDLFSIERVDGMTILTPSQQSLTQIHQIWRTGTLNFGHFLKHALALSQEGKIDRQIRFSDGHQGYWDLFLIRDGLFLNIYNKLDWGVNSVKFADSSYCSLQLQFAGHSIEKFNQQAAELGCEPGGTHGGECLFIHSDCKLPFELLSADPKNLLKIYVSYSRHYLAEQLQPWLANRSEEQNTVSIHRFTPTGKLYQFGSRLIQLTPSISSMLRAEALALGVIAEALEQTANSQINESQQGMNLSLRRSDIKALETARGLLERSYHQAITLDSMARKVGINRKKLNDGFQLLNGVTFGDFLLRARMNAASDLLIKGHLTADIADRTGYSNRSAFSGAFKRYFGCSPKQYLAQYLQQK